MRILLIGAGICDGMRQKTLGTLTHGTPNTVSPCRTIGSPVQQCRSGFRNRNELQRVRWDRLLIYGRASKSNQFGDRR